MTAGLHPSIGPVVEFGPGTGCLTAAILARGISPQALTCFEMNPDFVRHLRARYPGVTVQCAPAQMAPEHFATGTVAKVISGLPLLSMPLPLREAIVSAAFRVLSPGGAMVQFTYGATLPLPPESLEKLGLQIVVGPRVWRNLPPARVFRFYRRDDAAAATH